MIWEFFNGSKKNIEKEAVNEMTIGDGRKWMSMIVVVEKREDERNA